MIALVIAINPLNISRGIYEYNYNLYVMEERINMVVFVGGNAGLMYAT
jgi:hypothetical protein